MNDATKPSSELSPNKGKLTLVARREDDIVLREQYTALDGLYSIVMVYRKAEDYRYLQLFTHRDTENEMANLYAPDLVLVDDMLTSEPDTVRLRMMTLDVTVGPDGNGNMLNVLNELNQLGLEIANDIYEKLIRRYWPKKVKA